MLRYSTYQSIFEPAKSVNVHRKIKVKFILPSSIFLRVCALFLFIVITCTSITAFASNISTRETLPVSQVIVQKGDSLWSIAATYKQQGHDIRQYIRLLIKINNLPTSSIKAGDVLELPRN